MPRVARCVLVLTTCLWALGRCGSLYVRSEAVKEATANAKAELDKVGLAPLFDNEAKYLDELEKREYTAVAESLMAQRDDDLLPALQGLQGMDGRTFLAGRIDGYLQAIAGKADRGGPARYWRIVADVRGHASQESLVDALDAALQRVQFVPPKTEIPTLFSPGGMTLRQAIDGLEAHTGGFQEPGEAGGY